MLVSLQLIGKPDMGTSSFLVHQCTIDSNTFPMSREQKIAEYPWISDCQYWYWNILILKHFKYFKYIELLPLFNTLSVFPFSSAYLPMYGMRTARSNLLLLNPNMLNIFKFLRKLFLANSACFSFQVQLSSCNFKMIQIL